MAKRLPAGRMRHVVKLQSYTTALNTYGQASTTGTWETDNEVRAAITPLRGEEATLARQVFPRATYSVVIDSLSTMNSTGASRSRVLFGTRPLHIGAVLDFDEEGFQQELLCGEEK